MARNTQITVDGYSYEPPTYEEAQSCPPVNQSVYNPTVAQNVSYGFRPLYTPNGYNGLDDYRAAKRRRQMRVTIATVLGVFAFIFVIAILIWKWKTNIDIVRHYKSLADESDEDLTSYGSSLSHNDDLTPYQSMQDSSIFNNNDFHRDGVNVHKESEESKDEANDETKMNKNIDNDIPFAFDTGNWEIEAKKILEKLNSDDYNTNLHTTREDSKNHDNLFFDANEYLEKELAKLNQHDSHEVNKNVDSNIYGLPELQKQMDEIYSKIPFYDPDHSKRMNNNGGYNLFDMQPELQKELDKIYGKQSDDGSVESHVWDSYLPKKMAKLNSEAMAIFPKSSTSSPNKADSIISTGKSSEKDKTPDFLISHTGSAEINKADELLKSLRADINKNTHADNDEK